MNAKTVRLRTLAIGGVAAAALLAAPLVASAKSSISAIDTDGDGMVSMQEAHDAAAKKFDTLDTEHTGKLTEKQASDVSRAMGEMARHDKDHTIDKDEYMSGVDAAFKEADPKGSGMLNAKALKTKAGRRFLELVE